MEMRRLTLCGTFGVLLAALYFLWQYRFERSPNDLTIRFSELHSINSLPPGAEWQGAEDQPLLRLRVDKEHPEIVTHLDFPKTQAINFLHLRFQVRAKDLQPGKEIWQDGRCLIEWHDPSGESEWESDPFGSVRYNQADGIMEWVMHPDHSPAIPALRFENLGIRGEFEISVFEATVLRERMTWKIGRWILMATWLAWVIAWIGIQQEIGLIRSFAAAVVMLLMTLYFVVPGPWKCYRSFGSSFQIGGELAAVHHAKAPDFIGSNIRTTPAHTVSLKSVGKIPDKGDFTLRLKHYIAKARPLLHLAMLFAPALVIACLVGRRPALSLSVILALATEAAQYAFGYGFDWLDIFDLACDATGIALALAVHQVLNRRFPQIVSPR